MCWSRDKEHPTFEDCEGKFVTNEDGFGKMKIKPPQEITFKGEFINIGLYCRQEIQAKIGCSFAKDFFAGDKLNKYSGTKEGIEEKKVEF
jgi:hypothetical protein